MMAVRRQPTRERIGQVLVRRGIISDEQLSLAIEKQKREGGLIGEILIKLGFVNEEDIIQSLAIQQDFPYLPIANYELDAQIVKMIPEDICRKYQVIAVDKFGSILTVAMVNPSDTKVVEELETLTSFKVEAFVSTAKEIIAGIDKIYAPKKD